METFTPDPEMLRDAEKLVAEIRSGQVVAFAVAKVLKDESYGTLWSADERRNLNFAILQAAIGQLNWRFMQMRQDYAGPPPRSLGPVK